MTQKARPQKSFRGEIVDFDLYEAKSKLLNSPVPDASQRREIFIDHRRRRRPRRPIDEIQREQTTNEASVRAAIEEQRRKQAKSESLAENTAPVVEAPEVEENIDMDSPRQRKIVKE